MQKTLVTSLAVVLMFVGVVGGVLFTQTQKPIVAVEPAPVAGTFHPFAIEGFAEAQKTGAPIVISITSPGCGTCMKQKPVLAQIIQDPHFSHIKFYSVDVTTDMLAYDFFAQEYNATALSTLMVFKDGKEVARTIGDTDYNRLMLTVLKAI